jgi:hypothetical protein
MAESSPATPPSRHRDRRADLLWTGACAVLYLALGVATVSVWEPAHDEGGTWDQAVGSVVIPSLANAPAEVAALYRALDGGQHGPADVVERLMAKNSMHPPAYYWLINTWARIGGTGRLWLTLPALLAGLLVLPAMRRVGARMVPVPGAGQVAMTLLALSPWFVAYSVLARPYGIALCITIASTDALLRMRERGWRGAAHFVLLSAAGLYTIYHYVFVLVWHFSWLGTLALACGGRQRVRELGRVALLGVAVVIVFAPWLPKLASHLEVTGGTSYYFSGALPLAEWPRRGARMLTLLILGDGVTSFAAGALRASLLLLSIATLPALVASFLRASPTRGDRLANLGLATAALLPVTLAAVDLARDTHTFFVSKTSFALLPLLLLPVVRAWSVLPGATARSFGFALWATLFVSANVASLYTRVTIVNPFERAARVIAAHDDASHLVVLSSPIRGYAIPFLLTLRDAGVEHVRLVHASRTQLHQEAERALSDPSRRRVTLVNFPVIYDRSQAWDLALLRRTAAEARARGWRVESPGRGVAARGERVLSIASPVPVKYFSG